MINYLFRASFSVQKLVQMCSGQQPQKFPQLIYLDLVLKSKRSLQKQDSELPLQSPNHFYLIPDYYELTNYQELKSVLPNYREDDLKNIMSENAKEILKSNHDSLNYFINTVIVISTNLNITDFENIIEEQSEKMRQVAKVKKQCNIFSAITLLRYCKAMQYLLKNSQNTNLKMMYQGLAFQIILNKSKLQIKHIYSLLHYLQFVRYNQIVSYLDQKTLAEQVSKVIFDRFQSELKNEPELNRNPEVYSQLATFLTKTNYFPYEYAIFIEQNYLERAKIEPITDRKKEMSYLKLMFCKLSKMGAGDNIFQKILLLGVESNLEPQFAAYYLQNLLFYQIRIIMDKFVKNPTRSHMQQLISEELLIQPLINPVIQQILSIDKTTGFSNQDQKNQVIQCAQLLKYFKNDSLNGISCLKETAKFDKPTRINEINIDLESFLKGKEIEFHREHNEGLLIYDYWIPRLNLVIECDGYYHFVSKSVDRRYAATLARDFSILNQNHKLISINWFKQHHARFESYPLIYIEQLWEKLQKPDTVYAE